MQLWVSNQQLGIYNDVIKHCLRRLKLHGQNAPKSASPRHCEKIVLLGGT